MSDTPASTEAFDAEFGQKRICQGCGTKYYDFNRNPIVCPECGDEYDPEAVLSSRRGRVVEEVKVEKPAEAEVSEEAELDEVADVDVDAVLETEEDSEETAAEDDTLLVDDDDDGSDDLGALVVGGDDEEES